VYSVGAKPLLAVHPPFQITALAMILGTLPLLLIGGPTLLAVEWDSLGPATWLLLAYLSGGTIVVASFLWFWALPRAATARVAAYSCRSRWARWRSWPGWRSPSSADTVSGS
jgi:drug/metabolite transporter (DMT)-like permease